MILAHMAWPMTVTSLHRATVYPIWYSARRPVSGDILSPRDILDLILPLNPTSGDSYNVSQVREFPSDPRHVAMQIAHETLL